MECEHCKNRFSSKVSLYLHQTRSKYCLEKQGKTPKKEWKCVECDKKFTQSTNYNRHKKTCGVSKRQRLKTVEAQKKTLEQEREKLRRQIAKEEAEIEIVLGPKYKEQDD